MKPCECEPLAFFNNTQNTTCGCDPFEGKTITGAVPVLMTGPEVAAVLGVTRQAVDYNIRRGNYIPDYVTASGIALFRAARVTMAGVLPR